MLIYDLMPVESYKSIWLRKYRNSLKEKLPAIFLPRYDSVYLVVFHEGPISYRQPFESFCLPQPIVLNRYEAVGRVLT